MQKDGRSAAGAARCLSFLVRQAWLSMRVSIDDVLSAHGLSVAKYAALLVIDECPGISIVDLARVVASTRQSANELLAGLEQDGVVDRRPDPDDRRMQQLYLTALGRRRLAEAQPAVQAREEHLESTFSPEQRATAREWLLRVTGSDSGQEVGSRSEMA
jgi:DNA-binding MarR family transcriptional regulator